MESALKHSDSAVSRNKCLVVGLVLALIITTNAQETNTTDYIGPSGLGCTGGSCNFSGTCEELAVPGDDQGNNFYTNITGEVFLRPATCLATCDDGCIQIAQAESDCIVSAGYTYCPETATCIRPWEENCPFDGTVLVGPTNITVRGEIVHV